MDANWNKSVSLENFGPLKDSLFRYPSMPQSGHVSHVSPKSEQICSLRYVACVKWGREFERRDSI